MNLTKKRKKIVFIEIFYSLKVAASLEKKIKDFNILSSIS